ncbi:hypothetical protein QFC21_006434 [Naganishia friedmannii]|uniref:Uncharacterized protein n=1 Tax=Naganishia friedmannii TaxID=89922 RepID=A0ACC2V318_9TREE|nr:hypothetical protein QFC21_006434 [Naganishia friedmannii]
MGDEHKPSTPQPVTARDFSKVPAYPQSLSPDIIKRDKNPTPPPVLEGSILLEQGLPINPDLPAKDVLFIFVNFASYMKSPHEGASGVQDRELKHASRLLDHARELQANKRNRVNILHVKYRFAEPTAPESGSRRVPQPFATMLDPVLKIDQRESSGLSRYMLKESPTNFSLFDRCKGPTGSFSPPVSQAIFEYMIRNISPLPRFFVWSQVGAKVINSQLGIVSQWCSSATPPITMFSPTETRLRKMTEHLQHAIDIELYAMFEAVTSPTVSPSGNANPDTVSSGQALHTMWPGNYASLRSSSGAADSYYRAREKVMRQFGVIRPSYSSVRGGSYPQSSGSLGLFGVQNSAGQMELEDLIDVLGLGASPETKKERMGHILAPVLDRRRSSVKIMTPLHSVSGKTKADTSSSLEHPKHSSAAAWR